MNFGSVRGTGRPGQPNRHGLELTRPDFTQRHYEQIAESFRSALKKFPDGAPEHLGVCFMMLHTMEMLKADNPAFKEFRFIEWANTP